MSGYALPDAGRVDRSRLRLTAEGLPTSMLESRVCPSRVTGRLLCNIVRLDLEGSPFPEIRIEFAERTAIRAASWATRDDGFPTTTPREVPGSRSCASTSWACQFDIQAVIAWQPLAGEGLWMRCETYQVIILVRHLFRIR